MQQRLRRWSVRERRPSPRHAADRLGSARPNPRPNPLPSAGIPDSEETETLTGFVQHDARNLKASQAAPAC